MKIEHLNLGTVLSKDDAKRIVGAYGECVQQCQDNFMTWCLNNTIEKSSGHAALYQSCIDIFGTATPSFGQSLHVCTSWCTAEQGS
jgi:hypothetical protein